MGDSCVVSENIYCTHTPTYNRMYKQFTTFLTRNRKILYYFDFSAELLFTASSPHWVICQRFLISFFFFYNWYKLKIQPTAAEKWPRWNDRARLPISCIYKKTMKRLIRKTAASEVSLRICVTVWSRTVRFMHKVIKTLVKFGLIELWIIVYYYFFIK